MKQIKVQIISNGKILCTVNCIDIQDANEVILKATKDGYQTKLINNK